MGAAQKHAVAEATSRNAKRTSTTYHVCTVGVSKVDQAESCAFNPSIGVSRYCSAPDCLGSGFRVVKEQLRGQEALAGPAAVI